VGEARTESELLVDQVADGVEVLDGNRRDRRAALAVEVLVLMASGEDVEACPVSEMDVASDAEALEEFEVSVDGGRVDRELTGELLR